MPRPPYPSDLSDAGRTKLKPLLPAENRIGSPRQVELREVINAAFDCTLELTKKLGQGFTVEPWRWVVKRTFAGKRKCSSIVSRL